MSKKVVFQRSLAYAQQEDKFQIIKKEYFGMYETTSQNLTPSTLIAKLLQQLDERYVFPDVAQEIAHVLQHHLEAGSYDGISDGKHLAALITEHLYTVAHDKHLRLFYNPEGVSPHVDEEDRYTEEMIEALRRRRTSNYGLQKVEILEGNIGYFQLNAFIHPRIAGESMQAAMTFLTYTDALIIDLRNNTGGESLMVQFLCSYFFDILHEPPTQLTGCFDRRTNQLYQAWTLPYVPGQLYLAKPVYLLTSQRTFSGGEDFSYTLQQLKRACVIGERTGGGAHMGHRYPITEHFEALIPDLRSVNPISGTNWEGTGVQPDIPVEAEKAFDVAYQQAQAALNR